MRMQAMTAYPSFDPFARPETGGMELMGRAMKWVNGNHAVGAGPGPPPHYGRAIWARLCVFGTGCCVECRTTEAAG